MERKLLPSWCLLLCSVSATRASSRHRALTCDMVGVAGSLDERRRTGVGQQPVQHIHKPGQVVRRAQRLQTEGAGARELQSSVRDEQLIGAQHQEQPQLEPLQAAVLQITKALKEKPRADRLLKSGGENYSVRRHRPWRTQLGLKFSHCEFLLVVFWFPAQDSIVALERSNLCREIFLSCNCWRPIFYIF